MEILMIAALIGMLFVLRGAARRRWWWHDLRAAVVLVLTVGAICLSGCAPARDAHKAATETCATLDNCASPWQATVHPERRQS